MKSQSPSSKMKVENGNCEICGVKINLPFGTLRCNNCDGAENYELIEQHIFDR